MNEYIQALKELKQKVDESVELAEKAKESLEKILDDELVEVDENSVADHEKMGVHIEAKSLQEYLTEKDKELVEEAKRLTQHND